jgi:hypothetical protein
MPAGQHHNPPIWCRNELLGGNYDGQSSKDPTLGAAGYDTRQEMAPLSEVQNILLLERKEGILRKESW